MDDELDEEETIGMSFAEEKGRQVQVDMQQNKKAMPSVDKQMQAQIDAIPQEQIDSLLANTQTEEEEEESLLANQGE